MHLFILVLFNLLDAMHIISVYITFYKYTYYLMYVYRANFYPAELYTI